MALSVLSLDLEVSILSDLFLHKAHPDSNELDGGQDHDVVIKHHSGDQNTETNQLEEEEVLPANSHADRPDDEGPHAVQHHPRGRRQLLRHGDTGKVEKGD